jgi:hypothetical protein
MEQELNDNYFNFKEEEDDDDSKIDNKLMKSS